MAVSRKSVRRFGQLSAVAALVLALSACHYVGGGTLKSAAGSGQASFSFDLNCIPGTHTQKGSVTYIDNPAHVLIRGTVDSTASTSVCATNSSFGEGDFFGTYTSLTSRTPGGTFSLYVAAGNTGQGGHPTFELHLTGGPYDGFSNSGPVIAANIVTVGGPNG